MDAQLIARRYAGGLFELTQENKASDEVYRDFSDLADLLKADRTLLQFVAAPQLLDSDKAAVIEKVLKGKVSDYLYNLVQLVVEKHRSDFLVEIGAEYEKLYNESRGIVATRLVTAVPLTDAELNTIKAKLAKITGKQITVDTEVDPKIIGGIIAFVGEKIIDRSVRHDLDILRERLMELKVI